MKNKGFVTVSALRADANMLERDEAGTDGNPNQPLDHNQPKQEAGTMIRCDQYGDSTPIFNRETRAFKDSQEAAFRRVVRASIRRGPFTKSERDVFLAFVNHWFQHRAKGAVHPGREKLAKKAGVSIATVKRTLGMLRDEGVLVATAHENGLHGKATEYEVDMDQLVRLCEGKKRVIPVNGGSIDPTCGRVKMTHRNNLCTVIPFPSQKGEDNG